MQKQTDYIGNYVYEDNKLSFILTDKGRIVPDSSGFAYEYFIKDHLGNTRLVVKDTAVISENHYYPFGLQISGISFNKAQPKNKYLYNGKELQTGFGLDWYDYGARFYDAEVGRWHVPDPLAERYESWSIYHYVRNNPILRIDPNGMDDYTINKKTGDVKLVKKTDDETDRVLKTYSRKSKKGKVKYKKNGKAKVAFGDVERGILSDGINFQEDDIIIEVGGEGQPSEDGVKSFTLQLSEYIGKEIKGFSYSSNASGDVTDMLLGKYINNTRTTSQATSIELQKKYGVNFSFNNILQQFHTHPDGKIGATQSAPHLSKDVEALQTDKPFVPNASFIILYRIAGWIKPGEYDYTHEYKQKK